MPVHAIRFKIHDLPSNRARGHDGFRFLEKDDDTEIPLLGSLRAAGLGRDRLLVDPGSGRPGRHGNGPRRPRREPHFHPAYLWRPQLLSRQLEQWMALQELEQRMALPELE